MYAVPVIAAAAVAGRMKSERVKRAAYDDERDTSAQRIAETVTNVLNYENGVQASNTPNLNTLIKLKTSALKKFKKLINLTWLKMTFASNVPISDEHMAVFNELCTRAISFGFNISGPTPSTYGDARQYCEELMNKFQVKYDQFNNTVVTSIMGMVANSRSAELTSLKEALIADPFALSERPLMIDMSLARDKMVRKLLDTNWQAFKDDARRAPFFTDQVLSGSSQAIAFCAAPGNPMVLANTNLATGLSAATPGTMASNFTAIWQSVNVIEDVPSTGDWVSVSTINQAAVPCNTVVAPVVGAGTLPMIYSAAGTAEYGEVYGDVPYNPFAFNGTNLASSITKGMTVTVFNGAPPSSNTNGDYANSVYAGYGASQESVVKGFGQSNDIPYACGTSLALNFTNNSGSNVVIPFLTTAESLSSLNPQSASFTGAWPPNAPVPIQDGAIYSPFRVGMNPPPAGVQQNYNGTVEIRSSFLPNNMTSVLTNMAITQAVAGQTAPATNAPPVMDNCCINVIICSAPVAQFSPFSSGNGATTVRSVTTISSQNNPNGVSIINGNFVFKVPLQLAVTSQYAEFAIVFAYHSCPGNALGWFNTTQEWTMSSSGTSFGGCMTFNYATTYGSFNFVQTQCPYISNAGSMIIDTFVVPATPTTAPKSKSALVQQEMSNIALGVPTTAGAVIEWYNRYPFITQIIFQFVQNIAAAAVNNNSWQAFYWFWMVLNPNYRRAILEMAEGAYYMAVNSGNKALCVQPFVDTVTDSCSLVEDDE